MGLFIAIVVVALGFAAMAFPDAPFTLVLAIAALAAGAYILVWFLGTCLPRPRFLSPTSWEAYPVLFQYHEMDRGQLPWLSIDLFYDRASFAIFPEPSSPVATFRRERLYHRLFKWIRLSLEKQSGDRTFDTKVYAEAEDDQALPPLLAFPEVRAQVLALLRIPRTDVRLGPRAVGITIRGHLGWHKYFRPEKVREISGRLATISRYAGTALQTAASEAPSFSLRLRRPLDLAMFIGALTFPIGVFLYIWGTRYETVGWQLHVLALGLASACLFIYVPLAFVVTRGGSRSHRFFSGFVVAFLVGFPTFWIGGLKVANGLLDFHSPLVIEGQILGHAGKSTLEVWIDLAEESAIVSVKVTPERYRTAKAGESISVLLYPGAFREPWVVGVKAQSKGTMTLTALIASVSVIIIVLGFALVFRIKFAKIVKEHQRIVIFRLGKLERVAGPGFVWLIPIIDSAHVVDLNRQLPGWQRISESERTRQVLELLKLAPRSR